MEEEPKQVGGVQSPAGRPQQQQQHTAQNAAHNGAAGDPKNSVQLARAPRQTCADLACSISGRRVFSKSLVVHHLQRKEAHDKSRQLRLPRNSGARRTFVLVVSVEPIKL